MKKSLLILTALCAFIQSANSQSGGQSVAKTPSSDIQAGWGGLNYAVPESPAFKILGTSPSDIMRPTSTRNIAISIGNYLFNNGATIPQNLAVEIAPALFNPHVSLKNFAKNRWWYTSALSIGTKVNTNKSYAIGIGLKFKIFDKQDLRLNNVLIREFDKYGILNNKAYSDAVDVVTKEFLAKDVTGTKDFFQWRSDVTDAYSDISGTNPLHNRVKKEVDNLIQMNFDVNKISAFRDSIKNELWNKPIWDVGIATLLNSKDSLIANLHGATKIGLWTTYGMPLGSKGQLLIGITAQMRDTLNSRFKIKTLNIGTRAYYGNNNTKGFIEGNVQMHTEQKALIKASVGIERTFGDGIWLDFSLGFSKQGDGKAVFTPGFNLLFGNGEKKTSKGT
ncbi:MAG: hypothetical protein NVSMB24_00200 [Mucilaginibacter sp.]